MVRASMYLEGGLSESASCTLVQVRTGKARQNGAMYSPAQAR